MTILPVITVIVDDLAFARGGRRRAPGRRVARARSPSEGSRLDRLAGERFAAQRRVSSPLQAGAAVVTGGGDLAAPFVLHAVIRDPPDAGGPGNVRRALVSAWQRAGDWGLGAWRRPWWVPDRGGLSDEEAARLAGRDLPPEQGRGTGWRWRSW